MKPTPHIARIYLLLALLILAFPSLAKLYKGQTGRVLIAAPRLHTESNDPFAESVVFLANHSLFGAFGLVLGRRLDATEAERIFQGKQGDLPVYYGGPVSYPDRVFMMILDEVSGRVNIVPNPALPLANPPPQGARLYVGYAGWGMFQLNMEFAKNAWDTAPFTLDLLTAEGDVWHRARAALPQPK